MKNNWEPRPRYCPNCGTLGVGYGDGDKQFRFHCERCSLISVLTIKTRRSSTVEEYFPKYMNGLIKAYRNSVEEELCI